LSKSCHPGSLVHLAKPFRSSSERASDDGMIDDRPADDEHGARDAPIAGEPMAHAALVDQEHGERELPIGQLRAVDRSPEQRATVRLPRYF
jgi:hypothetical protein